MPGRRRQQPHLNWTQEYGRRRACLVNGGVEYGVEQEVGVRVSQLRVHHTETAPQRVQPRVVVVACSGASHAASSWTERNDQSESEFGCGFEFV